jgi:anti-sigma regulatory factor (Ser/Thr protein kinase)
MDCMTSSQSVFVLNNDSTMIPPLINYVHRAIRAVGLVDEANGIRVCVALEEALNNALFHGNLEISSELRTTDAETYRKLVAERSKSSPFQERAISIVAEITRADAKFIVRDEGPGFDPHGLPDPTDPANLEKASGRGLLLMRTFMDSVTFNDVGNEVTMVKSAVRDPVHADA